MDWHRYFGLILTDFFTNSPYTVEQQSPDSTTLIQRLLAYYGKEGIAMPYTMEDFRKEVRREVLEGLTLEERLEGLSPEEIVNFRQEVRKEALDEATPEELLERLPLQDRLKGLSPEEILKAFSPEEIEAYLKKLKGEPPESAS